MGILYFDTGGGLTNSGSTDQNAADLTGSAATVAGSVVSLDGSPDLSGIVTSGATQSSIYLADATNTNMKIFWITAADDTGKTVTVSVAPTGITSSAWNIGGRILHSATSVGTTEGAVRAGDIVQFNNTPAAIATAPWTCRASGTGAGGPITLRGKSGLRPVLECSGSGVNCIASNTQTGWNIENLELVQSHISSGVALTSAGGWTVRNIKISDAPQAAYVPASGPFWLLDSEITGCASGVTVGSMTAYMNGNYIHDNTGDGIGVTGSAAGMYAEFNIVESNGGRGIFFSGGSVAYPGSGVLLHNTIALNGNSGLEVTDADQGLFLRGNIFYENGNAAGEYNVEWLNGTAQNLSYHGYNCFYHSGGGGGANLSNLTANSTEITTDPVFVNAAGGNFALEASSLCKAAGFPGQFLGGSLGYLDMGAVQREEPAGGSGGGMRLAGRGGLAA